MEFWNSLLTEKSWRILQELNKKYNFILIGGWATYLWTKQQKSKDIDIVIDIEELQKLKNESLSKNNKLNKYEIKIEEIDVDIYVAHFSKLALPAEELKKYASKIEGFNVAKSEVLLILKQGAEIDRGYSPKGEKDRIDIMSLLFFTDFDSKNYSSILKKYKLEDYIAKLISLVSNYQDYSSLGLTPREFKLKKKDILRELREHN